MRIGVILGSTRQGRMGERVAKWVLSELTGHEGLEVELLDLRDYPLPFYAEETIPSEKKEDYLESVANRWRDKIASLDGYFIVTPEYNYSVPAVLKNAMDYLYYQWNDKPVGFISYSSGVIGGARCVAHLRSMMPNFKLYDLPQALHIGKVKETVSEDGQMLSGSFASQLERQVGQMLALGAALQTMRQKPN